MLERHPKEPTRQLEGKFWQQRFVDGLIERGIDMEVAKPAELLVTGGMVGNQMMTGVQVCERIMQEGDVATNMDGLNLRVSLIITRKVLRSGRV